MLCGGCSIVIELVSVQAHRRTDNCAHRVFVGEMGREKLPLESGSMHPILVEG